MVLRMLPVGLLQGLTSTLLFAYSIGFLFAVSFVCQLTTRVLENPSDHFWEIKDRAMPSVLNDSDLGTHGYIQLEGIKLHYVEKGDRSKPLMLCLHGFPQFWYTWRHQLQEFSDDYWVVAIDFRGVGQSEKPAGVANYQVDLLVSDVRNLITALGKTSCTLLGHDWGGVIAWYFLLQYSDCIDTYVILNSAHPVVWGDALSNNIVQVQRQWYFFFFQLPYLPELWLTVDDFAYMAANMAPLPEEQIDVYRFNFREPGSFTTAVNIYRANVLFETRDKLRHLGQTRDFPRGLIIFGTNDHYFDLLQNSSAAMVSNVELVYLQNVSHWVQEEDPDAVNTAIRTFFNTL